MSTAVYVVYATRTVDLAWLPDDARVVIVHNDDHFDRTSLTRDVVHITAPRNVGFGAGVNLAFDDFDGPRVVLCNPDLELIPDHWRVLTDGIDDDAVVTVPLVDSAGRPTTVCSPYPTSISHLASGYRIGRWVARGSRARTWMSRVLGSWGRAQEDSLHSPVGSWPLADRWVSGALLSIDVTRFRDIGGFDDSYFLYYEDVDLSSRLAAAHPDMRAVVAEVEPGIHAVGGTADSDSRRVEQIRLDSAVRWAEQQPGVAWSLTTSLLRLRRRWMR